MNVKILWSVACILAAAAMGWAVEIENVVIHHRESEFAGWPANEGMWSWGDEMLVAFNVAAFEEKGEKHSFSGKQEVRFARSMDGGETWKEERHENVVARASVKDAAVLPAPLDFMGPDFIMKIRGRHFYTSGDRGHVWQGPFLLPDIGHRTDARTSYLVTGKASCLFFIPCRIEDGKGARIRSCVAETTDGGMTLRFLSWISGDPLDLAQEGTKPVGDDMSRTMPSVVRLEDGCLVCALRNRIKSRKWTSIHESRDGGRNWLEIAELERGATNPTALVHLGGENVVAVYGNRRKKPFGISSRKSGDGGRTWGEEIMLREDGRKWDLGYPRAVLRPDGKIVAAYYFTTQERPQQHIAASIWRP